MSGSDVCTASSNCGFGTQVYFATFFLKMRHDLPSERKCNRSLAMWEWGIGGKELFYISILGFSLLSRPAVSGLWTSQVLPYFSSSFRGYAD